MPVRREPHVPYCLGRIEPEGGDASLFQVRLVNPERAGASGESRGLVVIAPDPDHRGLVVVKAREPGVAGRVGRAGLRRDGLPGERRAEPAAGSLGDNPGHGPDRRVGVSGIKDLGHLLLRIVLPLVEDVAVARGDGTDDAEGLVAPEVGDGHEHLAHLKGRELDGAEHNGVLVVVNRAHLALRHAEAEQRLLDVLHAGRVAHRCGGDIERPCEGAVEVHGSVVLLVEVLRRPVRLPRVREGPCGVVDDSTEVEAVREARQVDSGLHEGSDLAALVERAVEEPRGVDLAAPHNGDDLAPLPVRDDRGGLDGLLLQPRIRGLLHCLLKRVLRERIKAREDPDARGLQHVIAELRGDLAVHVLHERRRLLEGAARGARDDLEIKASQHLVVATSQGEPVRVLLHAGGPGIVLKAAAVPEIRDRDALLVVAVLAEDLQHHVAPLLRLVVVPPRIIKGGRLHEPREEGKLRLVELLEGTSEIELRGERVAVNPAGAALPHVNLVHVELKDLLLGVAGIDDYRHHRLLELS